MPRKGRCSWRITRRSVRSPRTACMRKIMRLLPTKRDSRTFSLMRDPKAGMISLGGKKWSRIRITNYELGIKNETRSGKLENGAADACGGKKARARRCKKCAGASERENGHLSAVHLSSRDEINNRQRVVRARRAGCFLRRPRRLHGGNLSFYAHRCGSALCHRRAFRAPDFGRNE